MRALILYTLARAGLFLVVFGLLWAVGWSWLAWEETTVLGTALVALLLSALASLRLLRGLRGDLSASVDARAARVAASLEASRRAEDD